MFQIILRLDLPLFPRVWSLPKILSALGQLAGIGTVIPRWERFHLNPFPTDIELKELGEVVGVEAERLWKMLPPRNQEVRG